MRHGRREAWAGRRQGARRSCLREVGGPQVNTCMGRRGIAWLSMRTRMESLNGPRPRACGVHSCGMLLQ